MSTPVTLTGRLTADPELTFAKSGSAIARFSVVTSRRVMDKATNEWTDQDTSFWNCTAFGALGENVCESLAKGVAVIVTGRAAQESWDDKTTGQKRTAVKVIADEVAPSLRWATAKVVKADRANGGQNSGGQNRGSSSSQQQNSGWGGNPGNGGAGNGQGGWGGSNPNEAPF
jgi:single-strand DNA-binding protein